LILAVLFFNQFLLNAREVTKMSLELKAKETEEVHPQLLAGGGGEQLGRENGKHTQSTLSSGSRELAGSRQGANTENVL
jgi:hypothetical protein